MIELANLIESSVESPPFYFHHKLPSSLNEIELKLFMDKVLDQSKYFKIQPQKKYNDFWYPLTVDSTVNPERTHGIGLNSFHIDYMNREYPPDFIIFICVRRDPLNGGSTFLSNISDAINHLNKTEIEILSKPIFRYWKDENTVGLGENMERFSIINDENSLCRFSVKMIKHIDGSDKIIDKKYLHRTPEILSAFKKIEYYLFKNKIEINLKSNEILIFNQKKIFHARQRLGDNQLDLKQINQRRLLQGYFNI